MDLAYKSDNTSRSEKMVSRLLHLEFFRPFPEVTRRFDMNPLAQFAQEMLSYKFLIKSESDSGSNLI